MTIEKIFLNENKATLLTTKNMAGKRQTTDITLNQPEAKRSHTSFDLLKVDLVMRRLFAWSFETEGYTHLLYFY